MSGGGGDMNMDNDTMSSNGGHGGDGDMNMDNDTMSGDGGDMNMDNDTMSGDGGHGTFMPTQNSTSTRPRALQAEDFTCVCSDTDKFTG